MVVHGRRLKLVEAAWHYRHRPGVSRNSPRAAIRCGKCSGPVPFVDEKRRRRVLEAVTMSAVAGEDVYLRFDTAEHPAIEQARQAVEAFRRSRRADTGHHRAIQRRCAVLVWRSKKRNYVCRS